jgi:hypothetical protein
MLKLSRRISTRRYLHINNNLAFIIKNVKLKIGYKKARTLLLFYKTTENLQACVDNAIATARHSKALLAIV